MAISKLVGRKVKVSIAFVQNGEQLHKGDAGVVSLVSEAEGSTCVTIDWSGCPVEGWGSNGSMWNVWESRLPNLSYLNNKPVTL